MHTSCWCWQKWKMWKSFLFRFKKCLAVNMKKEGKHIRSALFQLLSLRWYSQEWKCAKVAYSDIFEDRDPKSPSFGQPTIYEIFIWLYCFDTFSSGLIKIQQRFGEIKSIFDGPLFFFMLRICSSFTLLSFCGWHPRVLWLKEISTPVLVWSEDSIWGGHIWVQLNASHFILTIYKHILYPVWCCPVKKRSSFG